MSMWICVETGGRAEICTEVTWDRPETTGRDVWGDTEHEGANSQEVTGTREGALDFDFRSTLLMSSRGSFFHSKQKPLHPEPFVAPLTSSFCPYATFLKVWSKLLVAASTPSVNFWPVCHLVTTLTNVIYDVLVKTSQSLYYRMSLPQEALSITSWYLPPVLCLFLWPVPWAAHPLFYASVLALVPEGLHFNQYPEFLCSLD